jgi:hypothetical protein
MIEEIENTLPELKKTALDAVLDPKIALSVTGATAGAGATEWLSLVTWPAIVTGTGFIFSIIFGVIQLWRFILYRKRSRLEREKLRIDNRIRRLEEIILEQKINDHG